MGRFTSFVLFAEMRTGSNFLEANLNALDGVTCHGEAFNPHFIGYPNQEALFGITQAVRDENPAKLLKAIREKTDGLGGFRYFHDHDPRVFDAVLNDQECAKIVLTRNPVESYVSWKIAQATGQWKLTDAKARKDARAEFDAEEFELYLDRLQGFQITLLNRLQTSGQTAFYLAYEDLLDLDVINGLAAFLGVLGRLDQLDGSLKKQNPMPLRDKVRNHGAMQQALAQLDRFDLSRTPNFEPRRGAAVPTWMAGDSVPLIYMPVRGAIDGPIRAWLAQLNDVPVDAMHLKMTQSGLRDWLRAHPSHRSFTVIRHPAARAHHAFCTRILNTGPGSYTAIRRLLVKRYKLALPETATDAGYDRVSHRAAFLGFLDFLKGNLAGQTPVRVDAEWASQSQVIEGFAGVLSPEFILREEEIAVDLPWIAAKVGVEKLPDLPQATPEGPFDLAEIYDAEIERAVRAVYARDYLMLGFSDWK